MGVGPGQSLSWPHSAHSGSTDLPRGIRRPPGEVGIGSGSLWEPGHWQRRPQENILITIILFVLVSFCSVLGVVAFIIFYLLFKIFIFIYFYFLIYIFLFFYFYFTFLLFHGFFLVLCFYLYFLIVFMHIFFLHFFCLLSVFVLFVVFSFVSLVIIDCAHFLILLLSWIFF